MSESMDLVQEETDVYNAYSRPVGTALNYFSLWILDTKAGIIKMGEGTPHKIAVDRAEALRAYRKSVLKELKAGTLTEPGLIQRRMYWWMSKLVEWAVVPDGHWYKYMNFYQMSVWELEEK